MDHRRTAALWLWLANVVLGAVVGLAYLDGDSLGGSPRLWLFAHLGLVSTVATLSLVPLSVLWLSARSERGQRWYPLVQSVIWMLFQIALVIDTRVWGLFRYHFNSAAWNLITTKGSEDSYRLGARVWIVGFGLGIVITLGEYLAWRFLSTPRSTPETAQRLRRPAWIGVALVGLAVCVEKTIYASAELDQDRSVATMSRAFPLYPRLSVVPILPEPLAGDLAAAQRVPVFYDGARLAYPQEVPAIPPGGPRPNVLLLVIDSWRGDMLNSEVTPNMLSFARDARRFEDHFSGGNGTRFGVFSMLYGLHGSYWWPVLEASRPPVLLDVLQGLGYDVQVFSSASMDYPEFRRTAWARLGQNVHDDFGEHRPSIRDGLAVEACERWWRERDGGAPFFAFVLLDSAHQKYDFPEDAAPFTPYAKDIDYVEMAGSHEPELVERVRNRYRNAVLHADRVAGRLLAALEASGELERTLVIVTGDHGEEFTENGYWGHTGNFTAEQIRVPFLLRGPGVEPGVERRPTSHADIPATLLERIGADPALRSRWCLGGNLLQPSEQRARVVAGWEELGLWTASGLFRIPREPSPGFGVTVWDEHWRLASDQAASWAAEREALARLVEECERFLDVPAAPLGSAR